MAQNILNVMDLFKQINVKIEAPEIEAREIDAHHIIKHENEGWLSGANSAADLVTEIGGYAQLIQGCFGAVANATTVKRLELSIKHFESAMQEIFARVVWYEDNFNIVRNYDRNNETDISALGWYVKMVRLHNQFGSLFEDASLRLVVPLVDHYTMIMSSKRSFQTRGLARYPHAYNWNLF